MDQILGKQNKTNKEKGKKKEKKSTQEKNSD